MFQMSAVSGSTQVISEADLQSFQAEFKGELILPGAPEYDLARAVWNGMIDRHPALIARCASAEDVAAGVRLARRFGLPLAVRGGGHNVAGHATSEGGLVLDLSPLKQIEVDAENRRALAGAGILWGELDAATQAYGLATPGGVFSLTGIAGLTLGGGYGWLRNKFGLSCDNLIAAEVVTADGRIVRASETENSDLLWGLRGGGGNFGVVTIFEFRLHPLGPDVMFVFAFHDGRGDRMKAAIQAFRDFSAAAPDEVSTIGFAGVFPSGSHQFPEEIQGQPFFAIGAVYAGPADEGERILQPLRSFRPPVVDFSGVTPYVEVQKAFDPDYPDGWRYYWKSANLMRLEDEVIDLIVEHARRQPSPYSTTDLWPVGGAVAQVPADATAFYGRQAAFLLNPEANWEQPEDDEANLRWVREFVEAVKPYTDGSRYLNFAGFQEEGNEMMQAAFGPNHARLVELKTKWDPDNLFRLNQNIKPA
jgi:FAD/FMN-containing dehydrogenase